MYVSLDRMGGVDKETRANIRRSRSREQALHWRSPKDPKRAQKILASRPRRPSCFASGAVSAQYPEEPLKIQVSQLLSDTACRRTFSAEEQTELQARSSGSSAQPGPCCSCRQAALPNNGKSRGCIQAEDAAESP